MASELSEVFASFDGDRDGKITSEEFLLCVRALGHAPTESELSALRKTVDRIYGGFLSYSNFAKVMSSIVEPKMKRAAEYQAVMLKSFAQFNSLCRAPSDKLSTADLRMLLTRHGDAIDNAQFEVLLRAIGDSRDRDREVIDFGSLVSKVVQSST